MGVTEWVAERQMEVEESQNQRDKRVEDLWRQLDPNGSGHLDFKGLQKGLRKIDHRQLNPCPCSPYGWVLTFAL